MSVLWELDAQTLAVTNVWFGRTLIRSSYQLHYEQAQALLNGEQAEVPELARFGSEERAIRLARLTEALETLTRVARHLRAQRDRGGALELEGVEVRPVSPVGSVSGRLVTDGSDPFSDWAAASASPSASRVLQFQALASCFE